jgi:hypothetical protein
LRLDFSPASQYQALAPLFNASRANTYWVFFKPNNINTWEYARF